MKKTILSLFILLTCVTVKSQTLTTIAGNGTVGYFGDGGPAVSALLDHPNQLAFDQLGNLYIAEDYGNVVRKIDALGIITTVAGTGAAGFSGDGSLAINAELNRATGVAVDNLGNIYICDADNFRIRKVDATTGIIQTIAGTGTEGYSGDGAAAINATLGFSSGLCFDQVGNLYIAVQGMGYCVRKIDTGGIISTIAGTGTSGYNGDGALAVNAQLNSPASLCIDATGNLYIGDLGGMRVRKVNTSGIISTVAGNGSTATGGDGGLATSAQLFYPYGVAVDADGNMYICESGNNRIRKVNASGIISAFAGTGGLLGGYGGDNGPLLAAQFNHPSSIVLDADGNIFIGDFENNAVRKITALSTGIDAANAVSKLNVSVYPNPFSECTTIHFSGPQDNATISVVDVLGQVLSATRFTGSQFVLNKGAMAAGVYFVQVADQHGNRTVSRLEVQ